MIKRISLIGGFITLIVVAFVAGNLVNVADLFHHTIPKNPARQDAVKELVSTKAAIETGLPQAEFRSHLQQLKTVAELASTALSDKEKKLISDVISSEENILAAWKAALDPRCETLGDWVQLKEFRGSTPSCIGDLQNSFASSGISDTWMEITRNRLSPRSAILSPLLEVCLSRIQRALSVIQS